ncbi:MAG: hypothetical protein ACLSG3_23025 [Phocaeicola dorei]
MWLSLLSIVKGVWGELVRALMALGTSLGENRFFLEVGREIQRKATV